MIVIWRVTQRCNLACPFCGYDRQLSWERAEADPTAVQRFGRVLGEYQATTGDRTAAPASGFSSSTNTAGSLRAASRRGRSAYRSSDSTQPLRCGNCGTSSLELGFRNAQAPVAIATAPKCLRSSRLRPA